MRNLIFGIIGILWGGTVLWRRLTGGTAESGDAAYDSGAKFGLIFGGLLVVGGIFAIVKYLKNR